MVKVLIPLAEGFEEMEAVTVIDVLRRAGVDVVTAGIPGSIVIGSRNVQITGDKKISDIDPEDFDAIVLPGGYPGYVNLGKSHKIVNIITTFNEKNKLIGAICAAPTILAKVGILEDKKATVYPGMEKELPYPRGDKVVVDGNIITSQGPGTAIPFALKLIELLVDKGKAKAIKNDLVF
jgi:4-methyl-5(b-hydroxyethyl)-thiazole monophosphate biosynthesis